MKQSRLENLTDGIFAIVMTILVLELKVPDLPGAVTSNDIIAAITAAAAPLLAYVLAFMILFTYWRAHNYIVSALAKNVDTWLSNINTIFLLFVGLVPFTSYLLGRYHNNQAAIFIFGVNVVAIGLSLYWLRYYALTAGTINNTPITPAENRRANIRVLMPVCLAVAAIGVSFWNTDLSFILFTVAVAFNIFPISMQVITWFLNIFWQEHEEVVYNS